MPPWVCTMVPANGSREIRDPRLTAAVSPPHPATKVKELTGRPVLLAPPNHSQLHRMPCDFDGGLDESG